MDAELGLDRLTIRLDGVFDVPAAHRLARALDQSDGREVHVDLEHVREFHDLAVVELARSLGGRRGAVISGLSQHHVRLLRYLGMESASRAELGELA